MRVLLVCFIGFALAAGCSSGAGAPTPPPAAQTPPPPPPPTPPPSPPPPPPAVAQLDAPLVAPPGTPVIDPIASAARPIGPLTIGYNFNLEAAAGDILNPLLDVGAALSKLNPGALRIPGGTLSDRWSWSVGGTLSEGGANPLGISLAVADGLLDAANAGAQFTLNVMTLDRSGDIIALGSAKFQASGLSRAQFLDELLEMNLRDLRAARAQGIEPRQIEIGNEQYFGTPAFTAAYPNAADYAALVLDWAPAIRAEFPDAEIAAIAPFPRADASLPARSQGWTPALAAAGATAAVDALAIHPYTALPLDIGLFPMQAEAESLADTILDADPALLAAFRRGLTTGPQPELWTTEFNTVSQAPNATGGLYERPQGAWIQGLINAGRTLGFLESEDVGQLLLHVVIGLEEWSALTPGTGTALDFTLGSVSANYIVSAPALSLTASGYAMAMVGAGARGATSARALDFGGSVSDLPIKGIRFDAPAAVRRVIVNASATGFVMPLEGFASVVTANPWAAIYRPDQLDETTFAIPASGLFVPPFSIVFATNVVEDIPASGLAATLGIASRFPN